MHEPADATALSRNARCLGGPCSWTNRSALKFSFDKNRPGLPGGFHFISCFLFAAAEAPRPPARAARLGIGGCLGCGLGGGGGRRRGGGGALFRLGPVSRR